MASRGPRLTSGMLNAMLDVLNEAEAGGYEVHVQNFETEKERDQWTKDADLAAKWLAHQLRKRKDNARG